MENMLLISVSLLFYCFLMKGEIKKKGKGGLEEWIDIHSKKERVAQRQKKTE